MNHFYQNIEGWSQIDNQGILLNRIISDINFDAFSIESPLKIMELGIYKGRLSAMWNVELINRKIPFNYYAIDHFKGSDGSEGDFFNEAVENLSSLNIEIINKESSLASLDFSDEFFDVIYIDAAHDYSSVKEDLNIWYPKLKIGGIFCGDDYHESWKGVILAVDEKFGDSVEIIANGQWCVKKIK